MTESTRPKHVVIVDADNPMKEIHGEFFWREDHEQILAAERESAYQRGFTDGASMRVKTTRPNRLRRRRLSIGPLGKLFLLLVAAAYLAALVGIFTR